MSVESVTSTKRDLARVVVGAVLTVSVYLLDDANIVVLQAVAFAILMAVSSHITRRILMNRLDLQAIAIRASESPLGAAVVFASICVFLVSIMFIPILVLT